MLIKQPSDLSKVAATSRILLDAIGLPVNKLAAELAIVEALNNAVLHGNHGDPETIIEIELRLTNQAATLIVSDEARTLQPSMLATHLPESSATSGRGLPLIVNMADETRIIDGKLHMTFYARGSD